MAVVYVNGNAVDIGNDKLNLVQAAQRGGVFIPHYCWHPALTVVASCRMCLVETGDKKPDGTIAMQPRVVPACQAPAKDGTVIVTDSPKAKAAQQQTLESLLLNHPLDCPVCDKAGECKLQDYSFNYGHSTSRMIDDKNQPPNKPHIGEHITLFTDRCIMCSRCVRFTREISGQAELQVVNRGHHSEIDIFPGEPLDNKLAGNVVDLCPVGALCSKDFLYTQRVWFLKETKSVCPDCSTGCSIEIGHNKDVCYRLQPRENPKAQGFFMCDDGRFDYPYINSPERILQPLRRDGTTLEQSWDKVTPLLRKDLSEAAARDGGAVAFVLSPFLTCEEAFLLAKFAKKLSPKVRLALGAVPVVGQDDTYPKDRRGNSTTPVKFTIRAEKCPNRRGVEEVLRHFQGEVITLQTITEAAARGQVQALYLTAGYPPKPEPWYTAEQVAALKRVPLLIVQALFQSPLTEAARYVLPASSFAEKDGTFVNHANLAQAIHWAIRASGSIKTDGQIALDLLERRGLIHGPTIRKELAAEVPFFAALAGELGDHGVVCANVPHQEPLTPMDSEKLLYTLITIAAIVGFLQSMAGLQIWLERKISAWLQDRKGPNRVGPFGLLQPLADGLKFFLKEELMPAHADKILYMLAPAIALTTATLAFAVVPFGDTTMPSVGHGDRDSYQFVIAPNIDIGFVFVFAVSSITVYAIILSGWSANNKYSFIGGLRSSAQIISYEIPMGMSILGVVLLSGSLNLERIIERQVNPEYGSVWVWNVLQQPLAFLIFMTSSFAECNRLPFDLPECEQELVGGYHTEYGALKFGMFFMGEYTHMVTTSFLMTILFFGGWHFPLLAEVGSPWYLKVFVFAVKMSGFIFFYMAVRWTIPRFRFDQLMGLAWKVLMPMSMAYLLCVMAVAELDKQAHLWWSPWLLLPASIFILVFTGWIAVVVPQPPPKRRIV